MERRTRDVIEPRLDPATAVNVPIADQSKPRLGTERRGPPRQIAWLLVLLLLLIGGAFVWRVLRPPVELPPIATPAVAPTPAEPAASAPAPAAQASAAPPFATPDEKPLPALMTSDSMMQQTLSDLFSAAGWRNIFYSDSIIHRFVTTVDNLPRPHAVPSRLALLKPTPGTPKISTANLQLSLDKANAARYAAYIKLVDQVDTKTLVVAYKHFYPLLQEDYRELGYPKAQFNNQLLATIDDLLAAPDVQYPILLTQPKILYEYVDADLEGRSAGQKIMMRLGPDNEKRVKTKLKAIRAELASAAQVAG